MKAPPIGPRIGAAYQIDSKTVLRGGFGVSYGQVPTYFYITNGALLGVGFNQIPFTSPSFGTPGAILKNGLQYDHGRLYIATLDPGLLDAVECSIERWTPFMLLPSRKTED